jgi:4-hydroxybenzoate polyprenyltransferase
MAHASDRIVTPARVYVRLGRISNLPTVWTNVLAGVVLAGAAPAPQIIGVLGLAVSLLYVGGMYLNDAFDRGIDARERPERPIPSGLISARRVFAIGYAFLAAGLGILAVAAIAAPRAATWRAAVSGAALAALITYYDVHHKGNPLSPVVIALCRVLVYVTAALAVSDVVNARVIGGSVILLSYLIGLTYVAKQETLAVYRNLWPLALLLAPFIYGLPALVAGPVGMAVYVGFLGWVGAAVVLLVRKEPGSIPRVVTRLLAGICLLDALLIAGAGMAGMALIAAVAFGLTVFLQRYVPAT